MVGSAGVLELYGVFLGIILFAPITLPEQDVNLWDLEKSKKTSMIFVDFIRIIIAVSCVVCSISIILMLLHFGKSQLDIIKLGFGAFAEFFFLGSIAFFFSGITNNIIVGYMASIIFYIVNLTNGELFGKLALFQMRRGEFSFINGMLVLACLLCISGIYIRECIVQKR